MRVDTACCKEVILVAIFGWGILCHPLFGQLPPQERCCEAFSGKIVDKELKPVAGATVWLAVDPIGEGARVVAKTTADAEGRFAFPRSPLSLTTDLPEYPILLAKDAFGRLGICRPWRSWSATDVYLPPISEIIISLQELRVFEGRVVDLQGKPMAGITIRPYLFSPYGINATGWEMTPLVPELADEFSAKTDDEGRFVLSHAPVEGSVRAKLTGHDLDRTQLCFKVEKPLTFTLGRPGDLLGKLVNAEHRNAVEGMRLGANVIEQDKSGEYSVNYAEQVTSAKDGSFQFAGIPPGHCVVNVAASGTQPYYNEPFGREIKPGETAAEITIPLKRALAMRGSVVDKGTGEGIKDVGIHVFSRNANNTISRWQALTDAQGSYCCYVKRDSNCEGVDLNIQLPRSAPDYLYSGSRIRYRTLTEDIECPAIQLERGIKVKGTVVDEQGKAIRHADVFVLNLGERGEPRRLQSDDHGKFCVRRVPRDKMLYLRARTDKAASDPMTVVVPADMKTPLQLVISESKAAALQGICVDEAGRPVPGAIVHISNNWNLEDHPISGSSIEPNARWQRTAQLLAMGYWISDAEGRVSLTGLWSGEDAMLQIQARDYDHLQMSIAGLATKTSEPTKIVLTSIRGTIAGTVLDCQGKPVSGAKVFNRGDVPELRTTGREISATTDAAGRFRLSGFRSGPAYLFIEKEGYRFTSIPAKTGTKDATVKLYRKDEPIPVRPQPQLPSLAEQQNLAHKILERLMTEKTCYTETVLPMIRLDPAYVLKWSEKKERDAQEDKSVQDTKRLPRIFAAIKVARDDLDEGISLLQEADEWSAFAMATLARRYETSDPEKAQRCAEEAVVRGRGIDQPTRTVVLAAAAASIARAGKKESGRRLAEEAAEMAEKLKGNKMQSMATEAVAEAFAAMDFDRAVRFLEAAGETSPPVKVLSAVAREELSKAEGMLKKMEPETASTVRLRLAYRLAPEHPQDALRIAEGIDLQATQRKAEALAWIASAVAKKDRDLACSLIDRALSLCIDPPPGVNFQANPHFGEDNSLLAAFIALHAQNIGYADMESIVARVLSARGGIPLSNDRTAKLAVLLAQIDPNASSRTMDSLRARQKANPAASADQTALLAAWFFLDPKVAKGVVEQKLAGLSKKKEPADLASLFATAELLSIDPDVRLKYYSLRFLESDLFDEEEYLIW